MQEGPQKRLGSIRKDFIRTWLCLVTVPNPRHRTVFSVVMDSALLCTVFSEYCSLAEKPDAAKRNGKRM